MIEHELVKQNIEEAPCQETGCDQLGYACYLPETQNEPDWYYCSTHAFDHGFCKMCGGFFGGIESFEFVNNGYCDECITEIEANDGDDDDEDEGYYDPADDY